MIIFYKLLIQSYYLQTQTVQFKKLKIVMFMKLKIVMFMISVLKTSFFFISVDIQKILIIVIFQTKKC